MSVVKVANYGTGFRPTPENVIFDLPIGVYAVRVDRDGVFYLEQTSVPENPKKVYGQDTGRRANRYLNSFMESPGKSMGALLIGEPGSGKTLLMRRIINDALERGIHVILIEHGFCGQSFNSFIHEALKNLSAVVAMDEFEKIYDMSDDEVLAPLLTLFDGPLDSHKMFVCTANERSQVADPFFNRPSRIRYLAEFGSVTDDVIIEYLQDNLQHRHLEVALRSKLVDLDKVNFDCLVTATTEVNRTGDVTSAFEDLNVRDKYSRDTSYALVGIVDKNTGREYQFSPDSNFRPAYDHARFYVPKSNADSIGGEIEDMDDDEESHFLKQHKVIVAYVDRTKAPYKKDGCFVFQGSNRRPGVTNSTKIKDDVVYDVEIYIRNLTAMDAF